MLSEYFFTARDFFKLVRKALVGISIYTILGEFLLVVLVSILFFQLGWPLEPIFFTIYAAALLYWKIEGRISIGFGLGCLVAIIVMQLLVDVFITLPLQAWSEQVAVWAYYFLAIGVGKQILELILDKSHDSPQD